MAIDKIQAESMNLADTYAFTGTVSGTPQGLVLLQSQDADNSATTLTVGSSSLLSSTYKLYMITGSSIVMGSDDTNLSIRYYVSGNLKSDNYYRYCRVHMNSGNASVQGFAGGTNSTIPKIGGGIGTSAGENMGFTAYIYDPANTSRYTVTQVNGSGQDNSRNHQMQFITGSYTADTGAITGIQFLTSTGNIASGRFNLYGVANA